MTDVTPSGPLSLPYAGAAELLAATAAFQAMCSVATAASALPFIVYPYFDFDADPSLPRAVLRDWPGQGSFRLSRLGNQEGSLLLTLYCEIPTEYRGDPKNDHLDWNNTAGAILQQMLQKSRTTNPDTGEDFWHLVEVEQIDPPAWLSEADTGVPFCRVATYRLKWV